MTRLLFTILAATMTAGLGIGVAVTAAPPAAAREAVDVYEGLPAPRLTENRRCTDDGRSCIEAAT